MAYSIGSITAKLGIDTSGYTKGLLDAQAMTSIFGQTFSSLLTNPILTGVNVVKQLGAGAIEMGEQLLSTAERLTVLSNATGLLGTDLQSLEHIFTSTGGSAESAGDGIMYLVRLMANARQGNKEAQESFEAVGLSIEQLDNTRDVLDAVLNAMERAPDLVEKAGLGFEFFGRRAGSEFASRIEGGAAAINRAGNYLGTVGKLISDDDLGKLAEAEDFVERIQNLMSGVANSAVRGGMVGFTEEITKSKGEADLLLHIFEVSLPAAIEAATQKLGHFTGKMVTNPLGAADDFMMLDPMYRNRKRSAATVQRWVGEAEIWGANQYVDNFSDIYSVMRWLGLFGSGGRRRP